MAGHPRPFLILDFGSQLTQLIARRLRELNFYSEIVPFSEPLEKIQARNPIGLILSGGPNSVYEDKAPLREVRELEGIAPILGICYGMQLICQQLGGVVMKSDRREYGFNTVTWKDPMGKVPLSQKVWMSHGDVVKVPPAGLKIVATSEGGHPAAIKGSRIWAVQFHPEVAHTDQGAAVLLGFAELCGATANWNGPSILEHLQLKVREQVGPTDHVLCGLSGGVDSSVVAALLTKVLGKERVHCVFVNNGLLRKNEYMDVLLQYQNLGLNIRGVDAQKEFLSELKGKIDPEEKRKTIGRVFIEVLKSLSPKMSLSNGSRKALCIQM
jgi:GMP synthase (glutamine-hydrolysing)